MKWEVIEESLIQFMLNNVLLDDLEPNNLVKNRKGYDSPGYKSQI